MKHLIAPSVLSADFGHLHRDVKMLNESQADWIHCDVMDGSFVPNISFGFPVIRSIFEVASLPLDVHLMIVEPEKYFPELKKIGTDYCTIHLEACPHIDRSLQEIRSLGMKAGVALNPGTPVEALIDIMPLLDLVLIMSVNPGFGGQKFIPQSINKIRRLKKMMKETGYHPLIEVDGGVNHETGLELLKAGADVLVAGSYVFKSDRPESQIERLKKLDIHSVSV